MCKDQLSDAVQFHHKSITKPTITHVEKIMQAISNCTHALKQMGPALSYTQMKDLQQMVDSTRIMASTQQDILEQNASMPPAKVLRMALV